jgi:sugar phosphate isomerase/epimerase
METGSLTSHSASVVGLGCGNLLGATLPDLIDAAENSGFDRITAHPAAFAAALRDGWTEESLLDRLGEAGVTVTLIDGIDNTSLPGVTASAANPAMEVIGRALGVTPAGEAMGFRSAVALGARLVMLNHYTGDPATPLEALVPPIAGVCRRAATLDLHVCLEFIPGTAVPDLRSAATIVDRCAAPNLGICLDFFHHARSGGTVEEIGQLPRGSLFNIQISDRIPPPPDSSYVPLTGRELPGDGELPVAELLQTALHNSPDATVDIEVLNLEIRAMSPRDAAQYLAQGVHRWQKSLNTGA